MAPDMMIDGHCRSCGDWGRLVAHPKRGLICELCNLTEEGKCDENYCAAFDGELECESCREFKRDG